ncbi:uncharacterized protein EDB93DRAFT_1334520, partial [Suillus bovinus]|uniref:uncharacterized protein n=1 Tax=Suillus bovinus TaxID=48563 RepID=UPI001B85E907
MSEAHKLDPPPEANKSSQANANAGESQSAEHLKGVRQSLRKLKNGFTKKIPKTFKRKGNRAVAVQNVELEGPSGLAVQVQAALSGMEKGPHPQLVDVELQGAREGTESMRLLGERSNSVAFAASNAPGLTTMNDFDTTYLQPLKIIDAVLEKITDVHPYAKMTLGVLSAASKTIIAQAERDQSVHCLLEKLAEVYSFMTQDDTLGKIKSMRDIVGKIVQQTLECARFIRDYSETKSFWKRLGKTVLSETDAIIKKYSDSL